MSDEVPTRVLVVDDERDIREGASRILARLGLSVRTAASGGEGLELFAAQPCELILLDLKMPGIDGMDVLRSVRGRSPDVLVIVITGFATLETAVDAMKEGAYDFLPKPFTPDQLRLTVRRALERVNLRREAARLAAESRRSLRDVATEKSRSRVLLELLDDGVLVVNREGRVVLCNPKAKELLGIDDAVAENASFADISQSSTCRDLVAAACRGELPASGPRAVELCLEGDRTLLARARPVPGEDGQADGAVLVLTDVTEYRRLDRLKSEFVAKVSHEIRSPLASIHQQLASVLYELVDGDPDEQRRVVTRARDRTRGLITLASDLLDLSRLERRTGPPAGVECDLVHAVEAAAEVVRPQAAEKNITLELRPPAQPVRLRADSCDMESVFLNLLTNAVNYTPAGGRVTVSAAVEPGWIAVSVADTGIGIAPEDVQRIFERFYRVKNEQTRYVIGTGLGLAVVQGIVTSYGGSIAVDSQPGVGSTFTVRLPVASPPE